MTDDAEHQATRLEARDTHTPVDRLQELAELHPREVLANPVLAVLRLADPWFLRSWPIKAVLAMARLADADPAMLRMAARHWDVQVRRAVAENPHTDGETLVWLSRLYFMYELVAEHPNIPRDHLEYLAEHPWQSVRRAARRNPAWSDPT